MGENGNGLEKLNRSGVCFNFVGPANPHKFTETINADLMASTPTCLRNIERRRLSTTNFSTAVCTKNKNN